jgi:alkaline phosphatase
MRALCLLFLTLTAMPSPAAEKAKNVILFLSDAGGLPTLHAASLHGYDAPQQLYIQSWENVGLSDTSTASSWVTDSAAGMTAIVTGVKTQNGVVSMGPQAVKGQADGVVLKTILEHAEERGLSTGVITNVSLTDATPAACYAHGNDRKTWASTLQQLLRPRFGDGVDVAIGAGRAQIYAQAKEAGMDVEIEAKAAGRKIYSSVADVPAGEKRPVVIADNVDMLGAARKALAELGKNRKGYLLMIEWDGHTDNPQKGLDNVVAFDKLIREMAGKVDLRETLLVFTADHSFDLRNVGGKRGTPLLADWEKWKAANSDPKAEVRLSALRVGHGHTGEEVIVAAKGAGAGAVRGFMPNTRIFSVMMGALGWK